MDRPKYRPPIAIGILAHIGNQYRNAIKTDINYQYSHNDSIHNLLLNQWGFGATVSVLTDCQGLTECQQENSTLREAIQIHERFLLCQDVYDPLFKRSSKS